MDFRLWEMPLETYSILEYLSPNGNGIMEIY